MAKFFADEFAVFLRGFQHHLGIVLQGAVIVLEMVKTPVQGVHQFARVIPDVSFSIAFAESLQVIECLVEEGLDLINLQGFARGENEVIALNGEAQAIAKIPGVMREHIDQKFPEGPAIRAEDALAPDRAEARFNFRPTNGHRRDGPARAMGVMRAAAFKKYLGAVQGFHDLAMARQQFVGIDDGHIAQLPAEDPRIAGVFHAFYQAAQPLVAFVIGCVAQHAQNADHCHGDARFSDECDHAVRNVVRVRIQAHDEPGLNLHAVGLQHLHLVQQRGIAL